MALLELTLLGGFSARVPPLPELKVASRKNQALLAFLALTPGRRHAREKLVDLLWEDSDNTRGRNSLRQALTALRKELSPAEPQPVSVEGEILTVPPAAIAVDVLTFEKLAASDALADLKVAAELYRGDLLAGIPLEGVGFVEWLHPERQRIRELAIDVFSRLVPRLSGPAALKAAQRLVELDPLREAPQRILIALLAAQGQSEMALKHYRLYGEALEQKLGLKPSPVAQALYKEISVMHARAAMPDALPDRVAPDPRARLAEKALIAVLPFENRSAQPENRTFCDTLTGDISDAISLITSFTVVAGAPSPDPGAVTGKPNADYMLQGSVHRLGRRLRISTQLSDVQRGIQIWAEQFDCTAGETLDVQDMIVRTVAASVETQIELAERHRRSTVPAEAFTVQDLVARGNSLLYDETPEAFAEAMALGEHAVSLDPKEPSALLLRAEAFVYGLAARMFEIDADKIARGIDLARAAARAAPEQEWAHLALARAYVEAGQLDAAIGEAERALELNPSVSNAIARLGECYALLGRSAEAIESCRLAIKLNPRSPTNYWRSFSIVLAHFAAGDDAAALQEAGRIQRWRPDFTRAAVLAAASATALGRRAEADAAMVQCLTRYPDLRAEAVAPRLMPAFARAADRARLTALLCAAGLPGNPS